MAQGKMFSVWAYFIRLTTTGLRYEPFIEIKSEANTLTSRKTYLRKFAQSLMTYLLLFRWDRFIP